ncbi:hypothetical protein PGTUg99_011707 [Puccinia graminis f. sp. tritici]|uniref:No apical meristem-associated C-terminal domain-containing protein n=1 Tax=Puccinia graminis f. sp. tritici TaxID=56615 RepID=A0A5B0SIB0_PUCGR|nr:hypothetical protein PGTUg99_011707 [Puccinia graminis f. sp. tritici]
MVKVVDVESSAPKTPVAKGTSNKKNKNEDENTPVPKNKQATKNDESADLKPKQPKPPKWQPKEDQSLCTSWLNTLKDAVIGNNQTKTMFWDRIYAMFLELMDKVVKAKLLFKTNTGKNFTLDHCWGILHHSPKWIKHTEEGSAPKKNKTNSKKIAAANPDPSSTSDALSVPSSSATDDSKRPEGLKAAKKRKNDEINIADLIQGQKELLKISRQMQKSFNLFADDMVMGQDLSGMDEEMRAYFQAKRKRVMDRLNNKK